MYNSITARVIPGTDVSDTLSGRNDTFFLESLGLVLHLHDVQHFLCSVFFSAEIRLGWLLVSFVPGYFGADAWLDRLLCSKYDFEIKLIARIRSYVFRYLKRFQRIF